MFLCYRCINAIRSRGEKIFVGDLIHDEGINVCTWCEELEEELYEVEIERDSVHADLERDDEFDEEHDDEI